MRKAAPKKPKPFEKMRKEARRVDESIDVRERQRQERLNAYYGWIRTKGSETMNFHDTQRHRS